MFTEKTLCDYMRRLVKEELITSSIDLADRAIEHFAVYSDNDIILINIKAVEIIRAVI